MSTMLDRMRQRVADRNVANRNAIELQPFWHEQLRDIHLDPNKVTESQSFVAGAIYGLTVLGGADIDLSDYLPLFTSPIEDVQSVADMMWENARIKLTTDMEYSGGDPEVHEQLFSHIETALRVRRREWTEEFKLERHQSMVHMFILWDTVDKDDNPLAWKPEFVQPDTPPEWWVCDQLNRSHYDERREVAGHFQDLWTWEDPSHENRLLWEHAEKFAQEEDNKCFIDERMIRYWRKYEGSDSIP